MAGSGLQYTRTKGSVGGQSYRNTAKQIQQWIEEELADAGLQGVLEAQEVIEHAGTNREWSGPFKDREGTIRTGSGESRIGTGHMYNALTFRLVRGKQVGLDVGWPGVWEEYFGAQDEGFDAPGYRRVNQHVQGMGVIAHLRTFMHVKVDIALDRVEEKILNGL